MTRILRLQCQRCLRIVPAPPWAPAETRCAACGNPLVALGTLAPGGRAHCPPATFPTVPRPAVRRTARPRRWVLAAVTLMAVVGVVVIGGEVCYLEASRRREAEQGANEAAAARVESARPLIGRCRWNEAAELLQAALATPGATDFGGAGPLLEQVRQARAADVLTAAETAWQHRQTTQALRLLQTYLDDPSATKRAQASQLKSAIERDEAARKAREERALAARRAREEKEKRDTRIRATPAYRELLQFVALTRKAQASRPGDPQLLAYLLRELNVTDPGEQRRVFAELTDQRGAVKDLNQRIAARRVILREQFRSYRGFDEADRAAFELIMDRALEPLLPAPREG